MKRKRPSRSRGNIPEEAEEGPTNQLSREVKLGDLIWVRLRGSFWWPAQVVDANTVNESVKPSNRSVGEVLVRLYGSYKYLYVDPMKSRTAFEHVLKQNDGSYGEIFEKTLEKDLSRCSSVRLEGNESKSGATGESSGDEKLKQHLVKENQAIKASKSRVGIVEHPETVRMTRARKASLVVESLKNNALENAGTLQQRVMKDNLVKNGTSTQYQTRVSPRRLLAGNASQSTVKNDDLLPERSGEGKRKSSERGGLQNKRIDNLGIENEAIGRTSVQAGVWNKSKLEDPRNLKEPKSKTPTRDRRLEKVKPDGVGVDERAKIKTHTKDGLQNNKKKSLIVKDKTQSKRSKQNKIQKKLNSNSPIAEEGKHKTSREDNSQKKLKTHSPPNAANSSGKSQELSGRRMKVMQTLGLTAPSGSPFNRVGRIYPFCD